MISKMAIQLGLSRFSNRHRNKNNYDLANNISFGQDEEDYAYNLDIGVSGTNMIGTAETDTSYGGRGKSKSILYGYEGYGDGYEGYGGRYKGSVEGLGYTGNEVHGLKYGKRKRRSGSISQN